MKVYLVRHGSALSSHEDPERPLSEEGRYEATRLADFVAKAGIKVHETWHGPKARARETAQMLFEQGRLEGPLKQRAGLLPEDPVALVAEELEALDADICLVGHLPFMAYLTGTLVAGDPHGTPIAFETCAMLCLERSGRGAWVLRWFVSPRIIR